MAVGKISYNGGSGVKGAVEATYTIHADSEDIKAGNFVEKVGVEEIQNAVISDIVLNTKVAQSSAMVEMSDNRLLIAMSERDSCKFRLYDTTPNVVPVLLDEYVMSDGIIEMDIVKLTDDLAVVAYDIDSEGVRAFTISITDDKITAGTSTLLFGTSGSPIKLAKFNQNRFITYIKVGDDGYAISHSVYPDLTIANATSSEILYGIYSDYTACENISTNKVLITMDSGTHGGGLELAMFTYDESTNKISKSATIPVTGAADVYPNDIKRISDTKALVVYKSTNAILNASIINISSNSLELTKVNTLATNFGSISSIRIAEYETGKYMIIYDGKANLLNINGDTITMGENQIVSSMGDKVEVTVAMNNRVSILYKNSTKYPTLTQVSVDGSVISNNVPYLGYVYEIQKAISKIDGVAKRVV